MLAIFSLQGHLLLRVVFEGPCFFKDIYMDFPADYKAPEWVFNIEAPNYLISSLEEVGKFDTKLILIYSKKDRKYNFYLIDIFDEFYFDRYSSQSCIEMLCKIFLHETLEMAQKFYPKKNLTEENYGF